MSKMDDAATLMRAAAIIRRRAKKPNAIVIQVFCRVLTDMATKLRREAEQA